MVFGLFKNRARVRTLPELADFIDGSASYMVQRGIYDYARATAGTFGPALMSEEAFLNAADHSRWKGWPMGLAMMAEAVDIALTPLAPAPLTGKVGDLTLSVFDKYPLPTMLDAPTWASLRADLATNLARIALHPVKSVKDVPLAYVERFFEQMPIHQANRGDDIGMISSQLRVSLVRFHDDFVGNADRPALAAALTARAD